VDINTDMLEQLMKQRDAEDLKFKKKN